MKKSALIRLISIIGLVITLVLIGKFTVVGEWFNLENITNTVNDMGYFGVVLFITLFILGSFIQVPALLFVLAAILIYGQIEGTIIGYFGVVIGMIVNFMVIKFLGGGVLREIRNKRVQKLLTRLGERPLSTIIILRLILWAAPVLNYTLAMTGVRSKEYILGSSIGVMLPVILFSVLVNYFKEIITPLVV